MNINEMKSFQKTLNVTKEWINDIYETYDYENEEKAFLLLRATLKTLRDRISTDEAVHLGSQLPVLIRGFYFEGWTPHKEPDHYVSQEGFLSSVRNHLKGHEDIDLEMAVPEAMKIIFEKIEGEARQVKSNLPPDVQDLLP